MALNRKLLALALCSLFILCTQTPANAAGARLQALGGVDLLQEDSTNIFFNPGLLGQYSNRTWFSLGVTGADGVLGVDPTGGVAVRIKNVVSLGLALNRSPNLYGMDAALWPAALSYMPDGPGGILAGPDGPEVTTAPIRFPLDFFVASGDAYSKFRAGLNVYYAFGNQRDWDIDDSDQDELESVSIIKSETHLINATLGFTGGTIADKTRVDGWVRVGNMSAWQDQVDTTETGPGVEETTVDQIVALDGVLRIGGGVRAHLGDAAQGLVVTPGFRYDVALGAYRFDDNLVSPDSSAEQAGRDVTAHDLRAGVGLAWRGEGLLVQGTASLVVRNLNQVDSTDAGQDGLNITTTDTLDLMAPEISIGAEYEVLPILLLRAGVRSAVVGGRSFGTVTSGVGELESPAEFRVQQQIATLDPTVTLTATGGMGLRVKRFQLDAIVGGIFLGQGGADFLTRVDLGFSFD